jgi:CheY-like chemotaxis protein
VTLGRPRVLIVEDDTQLAYLYSSALSMRGIDCLRAADGFTALRAIEQQRPDLILLDLNLPTISGYTILRDLEKNPLTCHIPVIVVTGEEPTPELAHALVVMCKPCDPDHVAKIVSDHLPSVLPTSAPKPR